MGLEPAIFDFSSRQLIFMLAVCDIMHSCINLTEVKYLYILQDVNMVKPRSFIVRLVLSF